MLRFYKAKIAKEELYGRKKTIKFWDIDVNIYSHLKIS